MSAAALLLRVLGERGETLAVAESLTGGLVLAALTDVPGSSLVLRGGVVAYAVDLKAELLGVDASLLETGGPVQAEVAAQMAAGVAAACGTTWGLATTGVAGPGPADGHPAGTVFVAFARRGTDAVVRPVDGLVARVSQGADRGAVRAASVEAALNLALDTLTPPG
ncbi:CinA family protein [Mobilicoccus caccae]|uniref:Competence damage-inducible protein A n=1 Tax=Mobilicoccus caccae TaxID=1859295 RepID=A0ABQ6IR89_9MICO|nr:nicotinamide-nucleotide amidohydrolase family protein [Mobilicoccus caccae]GMA39224.1 competence damage-inducible protein A [Mobilicoccus caccae]